MTAPTIDGFDLLEEVGRGGFGTVYRAVQAGVERAVAVKVLSSRAVDEEALRRFERECRVMGALSGHPHIVTVYGSGLTDDGYPYLAMDLMPGGSFGDRLAQRGPMDWREVGDIGVKIAGALETAHGAGILHRDIKPANVLISAYGEPHLGDFGIARMEGATETRSGVITASALHAAPEILDGEPPSAASDVYSLASTLFALTQGSPAFAGDSDRLLQIVTRVARDAVPDLRPLGVPAGFAAEIERAMAKDPAARHASAETFGRALAALDGVTARLTVGPPPDMRSAPASPRTPGPVTADAMPTRVRPRSRDPERTPAHDAPPTPASDAGRAPSRTSDSPPSPTPGRDAMPPAARGIPASAAPAAQPPTTGSIPPPPARTTPTPTTGDVPPPPTRTAPTPTTGDIPPPPARTAPRPPPPTRTAPQAPPTQGLAPAPPSRSRPRWLVPLVAGVGVIASAAVAWTAFSAGNRGPTTSPSISAGTPVDPDTPVADPTAPPDTSGDAATSPAPLAPVDGDPPPAAGVGPGWTLVLYDHADAMSPLDGSPRSLILVAPDGTLSEVATWPGEAAPHGLLDWTPDGNLALLSSTAISEDGSYWIAWHRYDLEDGSFTSAFMPEGTWPAGLTRPTGANLVLQYSWGDSVTLWRSSPEGDVLAVLLDEPTMPYAFEADWLYAPDGLSVVVGGPGTFSLVSVDGTPIVDLDAPTQRCLPSRWWDAVTVLARCAIDGDDTYYHRLWLVPVDGSPATPLTAPPAGLPNVVDFGHVDAIPVEDGVLLQWAGDCGAAAIEWLQADGTGSRLDLGTGGEGTHLLGVHEGRLYAHVTAGCDGGGWIVSAWLDGTDVRVLVDTPAGEYGVVGAVTLE